MGSFDDAVRGRVEAQAQAQARAQAAAHYARAAAATGVVEQLLKDCASYLSGQIEPSQFEVWLPRTPSKSEIRWNTFGFGRQPRRQQEWKSPWGYVLSRDNQYRQNETPSRLRMLTLDGRIWDYGHIPSPPKFELISEYYVDITAETLIAKCVRLAGDRHIEVSADGTPIAAEYTNDHGPKLLHEWLADFAADQIRRRA